MASVLANAKRLVRLKTRRLVNSIHRPMRFPTYSLRVSQSIAEFADGTRYATLALALARLDADHIDGAIAELGVYQGVTSRFMHDMCLDRKLYLFDTFAPGSIGASNVGIGTGLSFSNGSPGGFLGITAGGVTQAMRVVPLTSGSASAGSGTFTNNATEQLHDSHVRLEPSLPPPGRWVTVVLGSQPASSPTAEPLEASAGARPNFQIVRDGSTVNVLWFGQSHAGELGKGVTVLDRTAGSPRGATPTRYSARNWREVARRCRCQHDHRGLEAVTSPPVFKNPCSSSQNRTASTPCRASGACLYRERCDALSEALAGMAHTTAARLEKIVDAERLQRANLQALEWLRLEQQARHSQVLAALAAARDALAHVASHHGPGHSCACLADVTGGGALLPALALVAAAVTPTPVDDPQRMLDQQAARKR